MFGNENKIRNLKEAHESKEELRAEGFKIVEKNNGMHWHITKPDYDILLNVWPTTKKWYVAGASGGSEEYESLYEVVKDLFNGNI